MSAASGQPLTAAWSRSGLLRLARAVPARVADRLLEPVLALLFPTPCAACGGSLVKPRTGPVCDGCWQRLPRHRGVLCRCGVPLSAAGAGVCGRCRRGLGSFAAGASLGRYEGSLRVAIHQLKYRGKRRLARRLADEVLADPAARALLEKGALLVPVPLHPRRQRQRGFNQSVLLARALGRRTGLAVAEALRRRQDTPAQTGLSAAARRANVRGAFGVRVPPGLLRGRVVVLVDDVLTTGATATACAQALKAAGAAELRLLTLARA